MKRKKIIEQRLDMIEERLQNALNELDKIKRRTTHPDDNLYKTHNASIPEHKNKDRVKEKYFWEFWKREHRND